MDRSELCLLPAGGLEITSSPVNAAVEPADFKSTQVFKLLHDTLQTDTDGAVEKARGIYGFRVKNKDGKEVLWIINAKTGKGSVVLNGKDRPEVTISISDEDVIDLLNGKLNPQKAYFQGKIKVTGNLGLAMKLNGLMKPFGKKMDEIKSKL